MKRFQVSQVMDGLLPVFAALAALATNRMPTMPRMATGTQG